MKRASAFLVVLALVGACGSGKDMNPATSVPATSVPATSVPTTTPAPTDDGRQRGNAFISSVKILLLESFPVQVRAVVTGELPTPCHQLAWEISPADEEGRIDLDVYSLVDPEEICIQVIEPFREMIPVGEFTGGRYVLFVNGAAYEFSI